MVKRDSSSGRSKLSPLKVTTASNLESISAAFAIKSGSSEYARIMCCSTRNRFPARYPNPIMNATVPAPPLRPVVSVSRNSARCAPGHAPRQPSR